VSFQRGRWSCSCVVCWKDKATVRASDGWHSTSTDFINSFMLAAAAALKCCAVQWDTAYWLTVLQSASGASLLPTICVYVLLLIIWTMCSVVSLYSDHSAQRCLNQVDVCQFIGIMGSGCVCRAFICHLCWMCVQQHVRWGWWKVIACQFSVTRHWHCMHIKKFVYELVHTQANDHFAGHLYLLWLCLEQLLW